MILEQEIGTCTKKKQETVKLYDGALAPNLYPSSVSPPDHARYDGVSLNRDVPIYCVQTQSPIP